MTHLQMLQREAEDAIARRGELRARMDEHVEAGLIEAEERGFWRGVVMGLVITILLAGIAIGGASLMQL